MARSPLRSPDPLFSVRKVGGMYPQPHPHHLLHHPLPQAFAACHANRAACHLKQQQYQDAEKDCTVALERKPDYVKVRMRRAEACEHLANAAIAANDSLESSGKLQIVCGSAQHSAAYRITGNGTAHCSTTSHHVTSHHITSHHVTSHHVTSRHITSHHITSRHITSHHITSHHITSHHITSHHITSHHITSHHMTSHHIASHHITSHHITSRHVTSRHVTSRHVTSRHVVSHGMAWHSMAVRRITACLHHLIASHHNIASHRIVPHLASSRHRSASHKTRSQHDTAPHSTTKHSSLPDCRGWGRFQAIVHARIWRDINTTPDYWSRPF